MSEKDRRLFNQIHSRLPEVILVLAIFLILFALIFLRQDELLTDIGETVAMNP